MSNRIKIKERVIRVGEQTLLKQGFVSPIDIFVGMEVLQANQVEGEADIL